MPVADFATVPRSVLGTDLGRQLAALRARSIGSVRIAEIGEGQVQFSGEVLASGAQGCMLSGEFVYDPARGIYVHRVDADEVATLVAGKDLMLFLGAQDYCGLRAQWPRVLRRKGEAR
jgi:hypothetical protein